MNGSKWLGLVGLTVVTTAVTVAIPDGPAEPEPSAACRPSRENSGRAVVERAIAALGLEAIGEQVLRSETMDAITMEFQSDRMYPPYLMRTAQQRTWTDWTQGVQRVEQGSAQSPLVSLSESGRRVLFPPGGRPPVALPGNIQLDRALDPWLVLADWRGMDVSVRGECQYRDYWRTVLERTTPNGSEQLYVDTKTGMPVKLDRSEPHYLWGAVHVEYVWSIWVPVGNARAPEFTFQMVDDETDLTRRSTRFMLMARDSAPGLAWPADAVTPPANPRSIFPDTVRISEHTFALVAQAYTNVVTLQRDTVFILDAQINEERARADSVWIGKLFTGKHPVVLVVTDLAWPHIAGVRFWVGSGATVVSHRASRAFLQRVVERNWSLTPDHLERQRGQVRYRFRAVDDSLALAGGALQLRPIDGISSEGALLAYIPADRFLYPGDYIQNSGPPGSGSAFTQQYAREVAAAVQRAGFTPERFAAMHVPLTAWRELNRFTGAN